MDGAAVLRNAILALLYCTINVLIQDYLFLLILL